MTGDQQSWTTEVVSSAPGKVILFGEHAVVYGYQAVVGALSSLRTAISLRHDTTSSGPIELVVPVLNGEAPETERTRITVTWEQAMAMVAGKKCAPEVPDEAQVAHMHEACAWMEPFEAKVALPALYMAASALGHVRGRLVIEARSQTLPIGAGLGSSASFSVALATCLLAAHDRAAGEPAARGEACLASATALTDAARLRVNAWAFAAEVVLHGHPSGLDNTASCYGGLTVFRKDPFEMRPISIAAGVRIVVVNTRVPRDTKRLVAHVRALRETDPTRVNAAFAAMEAAGNTAVATLRQLEEGALDDAAATSIAEAMVAAQAGLADIEVMHDALGKVIAIAAEHGCAAKLTGAGGGGCAFALVPPGMTEEAMRKMCDALEASGAVCFPTVVGGAGADISVTGAHGAGSS